MEIASQVAARTEVPLILMGYYNPLLAYGIEQFCKDASSNGVSGLIIPDLPPEESEPLQQAAQEHGLALIFLIPPTTPEERIAEIVDLVRQPGGFVYCVSLSGVTGARKELPPHLRDFIERVRTYTQAKHLPIAVGFGLSTPEHIATVTSYADGAVVGSALVTLINQQAEEKQVEAVRQYIQSLAQK
jgi:tryptophan synthase alpha chain